MGRIPPETVEQVLQSADILSLIGDRVQLKRAGSRYRGLCPFHNEKTPSFYVDETRGRYHCFGCGSDGDAAGWLMNFENRSFPEAIKILAQSAGIPISEEQESPEAKRARAQRESALGALTAASQHWSQQLWDAPHAQHAREYLQQRQLSAETARDWDFGFAHPDSQHFLNWAKKAQLKGRSLLASGLCSPRDEDRPERGLYARFRDRLIFPIHDQNARIVGFSGRILDPEAKTAKYINTAETELFKKSHILFGLHRARRAIITAKAAILCEGQLDCIALHQAGLENSCAPLGTAFTPEHAKLLSKLSSRVILLFDGDKAGITATQRAARVLLPAGIHVLVASLPSGEDPDSYLQSHGAQALQQLIDQAQDYFPYLIEEKSREHDLQNPDQRLQFAEEMVECLQLIPDQVTLEALILQTAAKLNIPDSEIRQRIQAAQVRQSRYRSNRPAPDNSTHHPERRRDHQDHEHRQEAAPEPSYPLPQSPFGKHLTQLLLIPGTRKHLSAQHQELHQWLQQLPNTQLARDLLKASYNPKEPQNSLQQLPPKAQKYCRHILRDPLLQRMQEDQHSQLATEALQRVEQSLLQRQLKTITNQIKQNSHDPQQQLSDQAKLHSIRQRLKQLNQPASPL